VSNEDIIRQLGYRTAAESVHKTGLASVLSDYSKKRGQFVAALQSEAELLGGTGDESGT
jgi:hypothetical protein